MTLPVSITDLCFERAAFRLGPLSFDVPAGGRLAIVGASGSGKTTLLRCLAGLERPRSGSIRIGTQCVADPHTHVPPDRRGLGLVFQDGALWSHMTVLQHLTFAAPDLSRDEARALLQRAGLAAHEHKKPGVLSGGEAQRLGLLRALAPRPHVLLLDEPLRSVDVHQRDALVLLLRTLTDERGLTTILVTHDRDEALALATDLVVLHEGRLVEQGPAARLLQHPQTAFTAAFLLGAACLPTTAAAHSRVDTAFGSFDRPAGQTGDLRLVLLPGDLDATPADGGTNSTPHGRVLTSTPHDGVFRLRIAFGEQIVQVVAAHEAAIGAPVALALRRPPRLLPWSPEPTTR
ncbi:MAG TPA: ABC transporter ATP-binding protein [Planctomycetota bacterium]|nr:ABC transporter ATP-binding protein [Planctomycetota bacterium]